MDQELWQRSDEPVDRLAEALDQLLDSPELSHIRGMLSDLNQSLGGRYGVNLTCLIDVFDRERQVALPLVNTGLSTTEDGEVYRTWNDSTPQRYVVDGEIKVVPHDRCPKCWGAWDFKWEHRSCPHCGASLGKDCKILLDSDVCPHCEKGKVSIDKPHCDRCGFEIDTTLVSWG